MIEVNDRLTLREMEQILYNGETIRISEKLRSQVVASYEFLKEFSKDKVIYGINTGFGPMAQWRIEDEHLKELIEVLSAILQGSSPHGERLTARCNTVAGSIGAVKDGVSSVSSQLGTATNQIIDHNKQALLSEVTEVKAENASIKKLVIFCLIVTFISMILNIMMLFH